MLMLIRSLVAASFLVFSSFSLAAQVDINSADAATLAQNLNGIGASKAQAIVDYRTENGRFASVDDLVNVQGIGIKTLDRIREFLIVKPPGSTSQTTTQSGETSKVTTPAPANQ